MWQAIRAHCAFLHFNREGPALNWVDGGRMRWRAINRRVLKRFETAVVLVVVHISSIIVRG